MVLTHWLLRYDDMATWPIQTLELGYAMDSFLIYPGGDDEFVAICARRSSHRLGKALNLALARYDVRRRRHSWVPCLYTVHGDGSSPGNNVEVRLLSWCTWHFSNE